MNPLIDNSRWTPGPGDVRARVDAILADAKPQLTLPQQPQMPAAWPPAPAWPVGPNVAALLAIMGAALREAYRHLPEQRYLDLDAWL